MIIAYKPKAIGMILLNALFKGISKYFNLSLILVLLIWYICDSWYGITSQQWVKCARYEMSIVSLKCNLHSTLVMALLYTMPWYIVEHHNMTKLLTSGIRLLILTLFMKNLCHRCFFYASHMHQNGFICQPLLNYWVFFVQTIRNQILDVYISSIMNLVFVWIEELFLLVNVNI